MLPRPLPRGGIIGICAPAGPVKRERLELAVSNLERSGYRIVMAPSALGQSGLFAASDAERRRELEEMFDDDAIDAIFCARGGVGCSRLLQQLDTKRIAAARKPFLGFSDITALQWYLWKAEQFVSFQGPLAVEWDGAVSENSLTFALSTLNGDRQDQFPLTQLSSLEVLRQGGADSVIAPLMPGNLTMITTLLGTPYMPNLAGTILLIEDVNEPPHRVDRMLFHLRNAGCLDNLAGLLTGDLFDSPEQEKQAFVLDAIRDATRGTSYPIIGGLPFSHGKDRLTYPVGAAVELRLNPCTLRHVDWCASPEATHL